MSLRLPNRLLPVLGLLLLSLTLTTGSVAAARPTAEADAIIIEAEQGIEWQRNARIVIARGDATAVRGDVRVRANTLTARYRERPDGSVEVWRIDADGAVRLTSPQQTASGEKGSYDVDGGRMSLSGGKQVVVATPTSRISADQRIDYDIAGRTLVARGNAAVVEGDRTLNGDIITIRFADGADGGTQPQRIEADGNMRMVTPGETITADRGTYDIAGQLATASGAVQIVQGANRLNGCRGEMNMRTGVSRLVSCPGERDGGRVQGVILPNAVGRN
ncbi:MAG TPA: LptA/OstA family protein [Rhodospirillales bacterium]|nr:LptA/OstA family protein [Rhodospirillales bacterium]